MLEISSPAVEGQLDVDFVKDSPASKTEHKLRIEEEDSNG